MVFQMLLWKGGFYLKKESLGFIFIKVMETLLDNKSDNFKFLTSFSLDIRAWSIETHLWHEVGWRTLKTSPFANVFQNRYS